MATIDKFWTRSGRVDNFEFELVDSLDFDKSLGMLDGVLGGKLTYSYEADLRVSGSLNFYTTVEPSKFYNCAVRIYYKPSLSQGQTKNILLATCFGNVSEVKFSKGRYSGTLNLVSAIARYKDDALVSTFMLGENKSYKSEFKRMRSEQGTVGKFCFNSDVGDRKLKTSISFEVGRPPLEVVQSIASGLDARYDVSPMGTLMFEKYIAPSKKECIYVLPKGEYSVTMPDVNISCPTSDMPNRIVYNCRVSWKQREYVINKETGEREKYVITEKKGQYKTQIREQKKVIGGRAQVSKNHILHVNTRGRWVTKIFEYDKELDTHDVNSEAQLEQEFEQIKKEADKKAAQKLSELTSACKKYTIECYYLPLKCGQVVEFEHVASGIKLHVQAMVTNIELNLGVGAKMTVTLDHIRGV